MVSPPDVLTGFRSGNPAAVGEVRAWIRVCLAKYRGRLASELEDLEQEVVLEVTSALLRGSFEARSRFRTFVHAIAHHKAIDRVRAQGRREWVPVDDLALATADPTAEDRIAAEQETAVALEVVAGMPADCRELWGLLSEGLGYREIGERLGVTEVALRSRALRCRQKALAARSALLARTGLQRNRADSD